MLLVLVVLLLQVFLASGGVVDHIATAILYAAIGLAIISMLSGVSRTAVRPVSAGGWGGRQYDGRYDQRYGSLRPAAASGPVRRRGPGARPATTRGAARAAGAGW